MRELRGGSQGGRKTERQPEQRAVRDREAERQGEGEKGRGRGGRARRTEPLKGGPRGCTEAQLVYHVLTY